MRGLRLVHEGTVTVQGEEFEVKVFCREDGRHFAKTSFSENDVIINDGLSLDEVLHRHRELLPLAVSSRRMNTGIEV